MATVTPGVSTEVHSGDTFSMPASNQNLYAVWEEATSGSTEWTITFSGNSSGSGSVPSSITVTDGNSATLPGNTGTLARTGYTFGGWRLFQYSGTVYEAGSSYTPTGDVTFYAYWVPLYYTVTFFGNGATGGTVPSPMTVDAGSSITIPDNTGSLVRTGYTYLGWMTAGAQAVSGSFTPDVDTNLYASWQENASEEGDFDMDLRRNFVRDIVRFQGRNTALATSLENVNELSLAFNYGVSAFGNTAYTLDIISSSTADTAAGTGARKIYIIGLDANWRLQEKEYTLNGQTAVTTTGDTWLRVFQAECTAAGTGLVNAGDIYIYKTGAGGTITGGVPGTLTSAWIRVMAGYGVGHSGMFTVPLGKAYRLDYLIIGARTQAGEAQLYSHMTTDATDNCLHLEAMYALGTAGTYQYKGSEEHPLRWGEKTDIFLRALSSTAAGTVSFDCALQEIPVQRA